MPQTPYPDLNEVLKAFIQQLRGVLGRDLVAAYLQGSFAVGDFDEHSDVDYVLAVRRPLSRAQVDALQVMHGGVFELACPWAQHLEGSYFPLDVLRDWKRSGEPLWYLDNGSRALIESDHCNTAVVRHALREHGITLAGPPPTALVDSIPVENVRAEMRDAMCRWGAEVLADPDPWANRFYQGFITLNYCRMWRDLVTGTTGSKRRGAAWAKAQLDASWADLIDRAWDTRPDPAVSSRTPADPDDYRRTLELLALIVDKAQRVEISGRR